MANVKASKILRNPWVWIFFSTMTLQIFRGSPGDAIIFGLSTLLIIFAISDFAKTDLLERKQVKLLVSLPTLLALVAILTVMPRHTGAQAAVFFVILVVALALVWHRDSGPKMKAEKPVTRARFIWAALCVGLMLWEFAANILGQFANSLSAYPTISVLIDPALDTIWGQGAFAALWLTIGFGLLRLGVRR